jgi:hypothetical protein
MINSVRIASVVAENWTQHLLNASLVLPLDQSVQSGRVSVKSVFKGLKFMVIAKHEALLSLKGF